MVPRSNVSSDENLEISFGDNDARRRRASLTLSGVQSRPAPARLTTSCFVHKLLDDERLHRNTDPKERNERDDQFNNKELEIQDERHVQSRLLSKKQLTDMAFSIRELSTKLGRFNLRLKVRNIFILTKAHDPSLISKTRDITQWLLSPHSGKNYTVYVEQTLEKNPLFELEKLLSTDPSYKSRLKFWTNELCQQNPLLFDIILALGGDGTVLYASWLFQKIVPPVLSFAMGSLGFLTKFDFFDYKNILDEAFDKGITVTLRVRLEATVMRAQRQHQEGLDLVEQLSGEDSEDQEHTHKPEQVREVLNDLVTDRGPNPTMSSIEIFGNRYHITTIQADGVCVATPTGSTAYNLAAGGSLCHPENPVILVTAICAHTLSFRPIIIPDTVVLRLGVPYDARASSWVSFDGKERVELNPGDYVTLSASRYPFPTVHPPGSGGEDWIDSLSQTLNWNNRQRQKQFKDLK